MELISIVVPVYKVEKYIKPCVDSLLSQTHNNIEVILVNDGSPDNCPQICEQYALKDPRIKVLHKKNEGSSSARNLGIEYAQGDFIGFVDSDDIISPTMFEIMYNQIKYYDSDIAYIKSTSKYDKLYVTSEVANHNVEVVEDNLLAYTFENLGVAAWNGLYKRDIVKNSFFVVGAENEDILWSYSVRKQCSKLIRIHLELYFWNMEPISLSRSGLATLENPYHEIEADLKKSQSDERTLLSCKMKSIEYDFRSVTRSTIYGFKSLDIEKHYEANESHYINKFKRNFNDIIRSPLYTKSVKLQIIILLINPSVYKFLRRSLFK